MKSLLTFEPIRIKDMEVRNRTFMPAMGTLFGEAETNRVSERMKNYIEARAKGGVGLIMVEYSAVMPSGRAASMELGIWDDRFIPGLAGLAECAHKWGARIGVQLHHAGRSTTEDKSGFQPVAPTEDSNPMRGSKPRALTEEDISEIEMRFAQAAGRVKKAGYDCVEIHAGHGYLLSQFLSPYSNKRTDRYGGSFENRMRFLVEILKAVRRTVGEEFPVSVRFSSEEYVEGGLHAEDAVEIAKCLEANGADIINVSQGILDKPEYILTAGWLEDGFNENAAAQVRKHVRVPVITVGQYHSPEKVENVLRNGSADMVALGRALIADPEFPNKMKDFRWDEIRRCIHCLNSCCDEPVHCTQNPLFGYEGRYEPRAAFLRKRVMVVGGGPAGLQAAVTAAECCHEVHLFEKSRELGGQGALAALPPNKSAFSNVVEYRKVRLRRMRVPVHTGCEVDINKIAEFRPDVVILATGSRPVIPSVKGAEKGVSAQDVLAGNVKAGNQVVVIGGGGVGAETADFLLSQGKKVTVVEMLPEIAQDSPYGERVHLLETLEANATVMTGTVLQEIDGSIVRVKKDDEIIELRNIDTVVFACGARAYDPLSARIAEKFPDVKVMVIGDAYKARRLEAAIKEGFLAGYTLSE